MTPVHNRYDILNLSSFVKAQMKRRTNKLSKNVSLQKKLARLLFYFDGRRLSTTGFERSTDHAGDETTVLIGSLFNICTTFWVFETRAARV